MDKRVMLMLDDMEKKVKDLLEKNKNQKNIDVFNLVENEINEFREKLLSSVRPELRRIDPNYDEDPNPIMNKKFESEAYFGVKKTSGKITFEDITHRNLGTLTRSDLEKIKNTKVAIVGVGACGQASSMILARMGVCNFILIDPDIIEASNAQRQMFAFHSTLGIPKVEATKMYIEMINSEAKVEAYHMPATEENVKKLCKGVDFIHDGIDTLEGRSLVHKFARENKIPWMHSAIAAGEARYMTFMPDDPPFEEVFKYSKPKYERGVFTPVPPLLMSLKCNDTVKLIVGNKNIIRYPKLATINMKRLNPLVIRDVRNVEKRPEL